MAPVLALRARQRCCHSSGSNCGQRQPLSRLTKSQVAIISDYHGKMCADSEDSWRALAAGRERLAVRWALPRQQAKRYFVRTSGFAERLSSMFGEAADN